MIQNDTTKMSMEATETKHNATSTAREDRQIRQFYALHSTQEHLWSVMTDCSETGKSGDVIQKVPASSGA